MPTPLYVAGLVLISVGMAWFWTHCARPALRWMTAPPWAFRIILAITVAAAVAPLIRSVSVLTDELETVSYWLFGITGAMWIVVVGLGYPRYRILVRTVNVLARPGSD